MVLPGAGKFKRIKGYAVNPSVLTCQRKNKRHHKTCAEAQEKQERESGAEVAAVFGKVITCVQG